MSAEVCVRTAGPGDVDMNTELPPLASAGGKSRLLCETLSAGGSLTTGAFRSQA